MTQSFAWFTNKSTCKINLRSRLVDYSYLRWCKYHLHVLVNLKWRYQFISNFAFQSRCQWRYLLLQLSNWGQCLGSSLWWLQEHGYWRKAEKKCYGRLIKERQQEKRQERWWKKEQDTRSTTKAEGKHCTKESLMHELNAYTWILIFDHLIY